MFCRRVGKKPKVIVSQGRKPSKVFVPQQLHKTPHKLRSTLPAPGGVGCLQIILQGQ